MCHLLPAICLHNSFYIWLSPANIEVCIISDHSMPESAVAMVLVVIFFTNGSAF